MVHVTYHIVEHGDGWAYKVGDSFSETFPTHDDAKRAASQAAEKQQLGGDTSGIRYQSSDGKWHEEVASGSDRPDTDVEG